MPGASDTSDQVDAGGAAALDHSPGAAGPDERAAKRRRLEEDDSDTNLQKSPPTHVSKSALLHLIADAGDRVPIEDILKLARREASGNNNVDQNSNNAFNVSTTDSEIQNGQLQGFGFAGLSGFGQGAGLGGSGASGINAAGHGGMDVDDEVGGEEEVNVNDSAEDNAQNNAAGVDMNNSNNNVNGNAPNAAGVIDMNNSNNNGNAANAAGVGMNNSNNNGNVPQNLPPNLPPVQVEPVRITMNSFAVTRRTKLKHVPLQKLAEESKLLIHGVLSLASRHEVQEISELIGAEGDLLPEDCSDCWDRLPPMLEKAFFAAPFQFSEEDEFFLCTFISEITHRYQSLPTPDDPRQCERSEFRKTIRESGCLPFFWAVSACSACSSRLRWCIANLMARCSTSRIRFTGDVAVVSGAALSCMRNLKQCGELLQGLKGDEAAGNANANDNDGDKLDSQPGALNDSSENAVRFLSLPASDALLQPTAEQGTQPSYTLRICQKNAVDRGIELACMQFSCLALALENVKIPRPDRFTSAKYREQQKSMQGFIVNQLNGDLPNQITRWYEQIQNSQQLHGERRYSAILGKFAEVLKACCLACSRLNRWSGVGSGNKAGAFGRVWSLSEIGAQIVGRRASIAASEKCLHGFEFLMKGMLSEQLRDLLEKDHGVTESDVLRYFVRLLPEDQVRQLPQNLTTSPLAHLRALANPMPELNDEIPFHTALLEFCGSPPPTLLDITTTHGGSSVRLFNQLDQRLNTLDHPAWKNSVYVRRQIMDMFCSAIIPQNVEGAEVFTPAVAHLLVEQHFLVILKIVLKSAWAFLIQPGATATFESDTNVSLPSGENYCIQLSLSSGGDSGNGSTSIFGGTGQVYTHLGSFPNNSTSLSQYERLFGEIPISEKSYKKPERYRVPSDDEFDERDKEHRALLNDIWSDSHHEWPALEKQQLDLSSLSVVARMLRAFFEIVRNIESLPADQQTFPSLLSSQGRLRIVSVGRNGEESNSSGSSIGNGNLVSPISAAKFQGWVRNEVNNLGLRELLGDMSGDRYRGRWRDADNKVCSPLESFVENLQARSAEVLAKL